MNFNTRSKTDMSTWPKIALFLGSDIVAHMIMNKIVPYFINAGFEPILYFPKHLSSDRANLPELKDMAYLERHILNETVYPFLEAHPSKNQPNLTPIQLAQKHGLQIIPVANVNDPAFVQNVGDIKGLAGALSIRCFQIFKKPIIDTIKSEGFFLNMHPGLLPEFRGVYSTARTMASNISEFGCTLHEVDEGIDTGAIWYSKEKDIDRNKTVFRTNFELAALGAQMIKHVIEDLEADTRPHIRPQSNSGTYFTYPTQDVLDQWRRDGLRLNNPCEVTEMLSNVFTMQGTDHSRAFEREVQNALTIHFQKASVANDDHVSMNGHDIAAAVQVVQPGPRKVFGRRLALEVR
ncbi:MAG TPA: formyltransferase family protein [Alphaproteobacteria bacterium]